MSPGNRSGSGQLDFFAVQNARRAADYHQQTELQMPAHSFLAPISRGKAQQFASLYRGPSIALLALGDFEIEIQFESAKQRIRENHMTLDRMPTDIEARVASVEATDAHGLRLMEMGMVPGAPVRVVKAAPLGDPIQVCVRNYHLALRRSEAQSINVTIDSNCDLT